MILLFGWKVFRRILAKWIFFSKRILNKRFLWERLVQIWRHDSTFQIKGFKGKLASWFYSLDERFERGNCNMIVLFRWKVLRGNWCHDSNFWEERFEGGYWQHDSTFLMKGFDNMTSSFWWNGLMGGIWQHASTFWLKGFKGELVSWFCSLD